MGNREKLYPPAIIKNIILKCAEDEAINGEIRWTDVLKYATKMFNEKKLPKEIDKPLKEDYWRRDWRQGYKILKEVNEIRDASIKQGVNYSVIETEKEVHSLFTGKDADKARLIQKLKINEIIAKKLIDEKDKLGQKIVKLEQSKDSYKEQRDEWKDRFNQIQILLFQFMEYSKKNGFPVENIYNTGKTRSTPVDRILASIFGDKATFGFEFEQYLTKKQKSKGIKLVTKKEKQKSALDEYGAF